jgi:UDP-glucose 4-epimerase
VARYLVTGGAGFIGSHIAEALLKRGDTVRILDNFATGLRENVTALAGAEILEGDVRSYHIVREAVDGVDFVLHQAALPSVPRSVRDPLTTNEVNVVGTLNVLTASRDARVQRLVYASSSSVYGRTTGLPKREDMHPDPFSPYAVSKLTGELYCRAFAELYGFETVVLRYFNVFGPRQNPKSEYSAVIPKFIELMRHDRPPVIYGDGSQTRDFTYVANVVAVNLQACARAGIVGRVFNVAAGERTSLNELVATLEKILGRKAKPVFQPARPGDLEHSYAAIDAARGALGYEPSVRLAEGLQRTVRAMTGQAAGAVEQRSPTARVPE